MVKFFISRNSEWNEKSPIGSDYKKNFSQPISTLWSIERKMKICLFIWSKKNKRKIEKLPRIKQAFGLLKRHKQERTKREREDIFLFWSGEIWMDSRSQAPNQKCRARACVTKQAKEKKGKSSNFFFSFFIIRFVILPVSSVSSSEYCLVKYHFWIS